MVDLPVLTLFSSSVIFSLNLFLLPPVIIAEQFHLMTSVHVIKTVQQFNKLMWKFWSTVD